MRTSVRIPVTTPEQQQLVESLPYFDGFPYLVTRVVPNLYHINIYPGPDVLKGDLFDEGWKDYLIAIARRQVEANGLEACLAFGPHEGVWYRPDGSYCHNDIIPRGGILVAGKFRLPLELHDISDRIGTQAELFAPADLEWRLVDPLWDMTNRQRQLDHLVAGGRQEGYLRGDSIHGGRPATQDDIDRLTGRLHGIPRGLERCPTCYAFRGECLAEIEGHGHLVLPVHCQCDNENRCAHCGGLLSDHKLNSNYYDENSGEALYVPGFCAFSHRCPWPGARIEYGNDESEEDDADSVLL